MTETEIVLPTATSGYEYKRQLAQFALSLLDLSESIGFRMSARGWAYTLEGMRLINKDQFDRVESLVNTCRERGYLPIDFTAEEEGRKFAGIETPTADSIPTFLKKYVDYVGECERSFTPAWWDGEKYYIQMLVEKIDLKTLFEPVCKDYKIPIATSKGWSSMLQRAEYARRFKEAEEMGLDCVLLYCGDHDPDGLRISKFLFDNLDQIKNIVWDDGTEGYDPQDLTIDRFGLNYDFILRHNLTWIDNLITGSGKNLADPHHKNFNMPYVQEYLASIGERKCEANAIVKDPAIGRVLCRMVIESYLGEDARDRFEARRERIDNEVSCLRSGLTITTDEELTLDNAIAIFSNKLERIIEQEEENNYNDDNEEDE